MSNSIIDGILKGHEIERHEALALIRMPLADLADGADKIRREFCSDAFDLCSIINAKSGECPEDCKYCAQSCKYSTNIDHYDLLSSDRIVERAKHDADKGVMRFSIVTSGKRPTSAELDRICDTVRRIRTETGISVCASLGLLSYPEYLKLKESGVSRIHNNLETSRRYFPCVCTTHSYDDKINAVKAAQDTGMEVCSGGIIGLGETAEDRIDMALTLRKLNIRSVPINILNPIPGTPYEHNPPLNDQDVLRCIAIFRCIMPYAAIRLAGGRGLLSDKGAHCFTGGANAAITGDMLTTSGIAIHTDIEMIRSAGYTAKRSVK